MSSYGVTDDFGSALDEMVSGCPDDQDDSDSRQDDDEVETRSQEDDED